MDYLLAHDVGTSGDKAALLTTDGRLVATAYEPYPTHFPRSRWAEQDPEDWWRAAGRATQQVLQKTAAAAGEILGLSFSAQMLNVLALDRDGNPIGPCIHWLDGRAGAEAQTIMRRLGGPGIFAALVGTAVTAKDVLPKYLWVKRHQPDVYRRAAALVDAASYLLARASGRLVVEWGSASVTGLFNLKSKTWDGLLTRFFGLSPAKFPELVPSTARVGGLTALAAAHLGLLPGTPVFAGSGDAMCAAVGSGAVGEGDGHICLGTSGWAAVMSGRRVVGRRGIATIQSADPQKLLSIGESETAGACLRWAARELYCDPSNPDVYTQMDQDVAATDPGAAGLIFTPWMYGERCPVGDASLRAGFINLGANHTRPQMARAIYEGVAYNLRWILESFDELYAFHPDPLRVIGGGARGLPWLQIIADVTGRTLEGAAQAQEAGAVGAGLLAAVGLGVYPSVDAVKQIVPATQVIRPNPAVHPRYDQSYATFREIYQALRGVYGRINRPDAPEAGGD